MVQTNIEYFNSNLKRFVLDIIKIFPDLDGELREYYDIILTDESNNEDKFIKRYMRKLGDKKEFISQKNNELFAESICVLKGVDFKDLMVDEKITDTIRDTIWDYIQTLYVIGETIVSDSNSIQKLVENFKKMREADGDMKGITQEESGEQDEQVLEMLKNLSEKTKNSENTPELNEELINNGLIGNLAKELAEDINLDEFNLNIDDSSENVNDVFSNLISGDNPMKFMNLIQNVGQKIQTKLSDGGLDQSQLVDEAQQMMGMLGNNNPLFENLLGKAKQNATAAPPQNTNNNNPTRDRLRRKLEQRKNAKK